MLLIFGKNGQLKKSMSFGGAYSGEKQMGSLDTMMMFSSDSNKILDSTYGLLVERSTTLYHTWGPARGGVNKQDEYAIGPGLLFRSQMDYKTLGENKEYAKDWSRDFSKIVDSYSRKMNLYQKQSLAFRSALINGDSLYLFDRKNNELNDIVPAQNNQIDWTYNLGDYTLGIEHDDLLRGTGIRQASGKNLSFVDSVGDRNVIQFLFAELAGQLRGYPMSYSMINAARNDDTHEDAIRHRAVMEAILIGTFETKGTDVQQQFKNLGAAARKRKGKSWNPLSKVGNAENIGAGSMLTLGAEESMKWGDMKTPSNNYGTFKEWMINYAAMHTGTPPEVIMSKYESSFTAHKGSLNDFKKSFTKKRKTFERLCMDSIIFEIAKDAIQQGFIKAPGFFDGGWRVQQAYLQGLYLGPVPGHINPLQEVKANALSVESGFELRSSFANLNGHEWDSFLLEYETQAEEYSKLPQDFQDRILFEQEKNNADNNKNNTEGGDD